MAAGYDGSIKIDTRIDSAGFNKGVGGMSSAIGKLGGVLAAAFSVAVIVRFVKTAIAAGVEVQAINRRFYTLFGTMGEAAAAQLNAFGKAVNMDTEDLQSMATTMQNVFLGLGIIGKQASDLSVDMTKLATDTALFWGVDPAEMIDTFQMGMLGMTRGLRQYGVSVSDAEIKQRALNMGLYAGAGALTAQAKALAIAALLQDKFAYAIGYAAQSTSTWVGQIRGINVAWHDFLESMGAGFMTVLQGLLPLIATLLGWLNALAQAFANLMGIIFGVRVQISAGSGDMSGAAGSAGDLSDNMGDLADNTKAAGKAAKGALAPFDELNVLQQEEKTGGGGALPPLPGIGPIKLTPPDFKQVGGLLQKWIQDHLAQIQALFAPLIAAFERLKKALEPLGKTIWEGLKWAWDNILVPLGKWTITELLPHFLDLLAKGATFLNTALIALAPAGQWLWDNFLKPLFGFVGTGIIWLIDTLGKAIDLLGKWIETHQTAFQIFVGILLAIGIAFLIMNVPIAATIALILGILFVIGVLVTYWPQISEAATKAWDAIRGGAEAAWAGIVLLWGAFSTWFQTNVIDPIATGWTTFVTGLTMGWDNFWSGAQTTAKNMINGIIGFINRLISGVINGINSMIRALNSIKIDLPKWIPLIGGSHFGLSIPAISAPQIPYLAQGAVIPPNARFLAVMGEQRSGKNIEAPEALIRQIVREETAGAGGPITINFAGNMGELIRVLKPYIDRENSRIGTSLIQGAT